MSNLESYQTEAPVSKGSLWFARISVFLVTCGATFAFHLRYTGNLFSPELQASGAVLLFNYLLFLMMLLRKGPDFMGGHLGFGLLLLSTKLFVNTFTILLLIGLQAVRTPVFIPVFFVGYFVMLAMTIWTLHRTNTEI